MRLFFSFIFSLSFISIASAQINHLNLTEIVTDDAHIMSDIELYELRNKLKSYEEEKTHQIVVLTINNLGENTIEAYANAVFNQNKLGQKNKDNGVLILFSLNDREVRIEVGYGLEPILTDALSSRIIREIMIPEFKKELYYEGINEATSEIIKLLDDPLYRNEFADNKDQNSTSISQIIIKVLFILFFTAIFCVFIFFGSKFFLINYKSLIYLHRGLIIGKVSILSYPFFLVSHIFSTLFSTIFIIFPLVSFCFLILSSFGNSDNTYLSNLAEYIFSSDFFTIKNVIILIISFLILFFILLPYIIIFFTNKPKFNSFKLSFKNNKTYLRKYLNYYRTSNSSSSYSSSTYTSSGYSSSSSSSFSGGGGSSGGGGASGSW